jgi:hypothetical protein
LRLVFVWLKEALGTRIQPIGGMSSCTVFSLWRNCLYRPQSSGPRLGLKIICWGGNRLRETGCWENSRGYAHRRGASEAVGLGRTFRRCRIRGRI